MERELTGSLYATPSVLEGVGRIFDFSGALNQYALSLTGDEADLIGLRADWVAIGDDLRRVMIAYGKQSGRQD